MSLSERFWAKVAIAGSDDCWLWTGALNNVGYGGIWVREQQKRRLATHVSWFIAYGDWPSLNVCHRCDTPACVNPHHLFLGTHKKNTQDAISKGRFHDGHPKLNREAVLAIRKDDRSQREIAHAYGIIQQTVSQIKRRATWAWLK